MKKYDELSDMAAKRWHAKKEGRAALADVFKGPTYYSDNFKLHEVAFVAGYRAAQRDARKGKKKGSSPRPAKKARKQ